MTVRTELIASEPADALAGLLDIAPPSGVLPALWHWVYLLEYPRQSELGLDGHPRHGIPEPPGAGYRRMFAGGRVTAVSPLRLGELATRTTEVLSTVQRTGKSGPLIFVTVQHRIEQGGTLSVVEEQDIVYRLTGGSTVAAPAEPATASMSDDRLEVGVDPVLLFRFSALTYNAHRIHYDTDYARSEGYPGLVVHGPLQALLMGELLRRRGLDMVGREFAYRLIAPVFSPQRLTVTAGFQEHTAAATVRDANGRTTATSKLGATRF